MCCHKKCSDIALLSGRGLEVFGRTSYIYIYIYIYICIYLSSSVTVIWVLCRVLLWCLFNSQGLQMRLVSFLTSVKCTNLVEDDFCPFMMVIFSRWRCFILKSARTIGSLVSYTKKRIVEGQHYTKWKRKRIKILKNWREREREKPNKEK